MTLSSVATRYARALADVVTGSAAPLRPEAAVSELRAFESALQSSNELRIALISPAPWSGGGSPASYSPRTAFQRQFVCEFIKGPWQS